MHPQWWSPYNVYIEYGQGCKYLITSMAPLEHQRGFIPHLTKGKMIARKADLQDVRVSGAQPALKDRSLRSQVAIMKVDGNEPIFRCILPKMMTHRPLLTTRSSKTTPPGSSISITGKSKARALRKVGSWTYLMTRATDSLLPTSMSMPAPLLRQASGTAGNQLGMIADRDIPVRLIGRNFRAMTGRFSRTMHTSLDLVTLNLLRDIPVLLTW